MKIIDLTRPLEVVEDKSFPAIVQPLLRILAPDIKFVDNQAGAEIMMGIFGCKKEDLPDGEGWAEEVITMSSHLGTHLDAPLHYGSKTGDKKAKSIDQIDLDKLVADACVLNFSKKRATSQPISIDDLKEALDKIAYEIKPGDAVLIRTDHDKYPLANTMKYNYPGMTRESAAWLADQGALIGGTDAVGWDRPFPAMILDYKKTGDKKYIWDAHFAHRDKEFYVVQQLANLQMLPPSGFKIGIFPLKLVGTSAAPARVVAFLEQ